MVDHLVVGCGSGKSFSFQKEGLLIGDVVKNHEEFRKAGNRKGNEMWVTGKEIEEAKKHDLLSYLKIADPFELKRFSHDTWCLRSHDSFKKISNGLWHSVLPRHGGGVPWTI